MQNKLFFLAKYSMLERWYKIGLADVACMVREFLYMIVELLIKNVNIHIMLN